MDGLLKKRLSILSGYKDQWFTLKNEGYLQYYNQKPTSEDKRPKGQILLLLSDYSVKNDNVSFVITSASNEKYRLKAENSEKRQVWLKAINEIRTQLYDRMFKGFYDSPVHERKNVKTDGGNDNGEIEEKCDSNVKLKQAQVSIGNGTIATETDIASLFKKRKKPFVVVAAIDFGTTYSGCAFSTVQSFKTNPLNVVSVEIDNNNAFSYKTPTVLLLKPDGSFDSFGEDAEEHFMRLAESEKSDEVQKWFYFDRFKMQLHKKDLKSNMTLTDMSGKKKKAKIVFAICIEFIKNKVLERLSSAISDLEEDDVHWVLTVPAIWTDQARQFMIEAAEKAGIEKQNLSLALEPEAAAMCCKYIALEKGDNGDTSELKSFENGARFTVVDLGGGTIDITVSEVLPSGQLKEIYNATGGPWGGNYINDQILKTLNEIVGWETLRHLKIEDLEEYLDLVRNIEQRKRGVQYKSDLTLKISKEFSKKINISEKYAASVQTKKTALILSASLIKSIFQSSVDSMIKHVDNLLSKEETRGVSTILLVGGYASSDFVQQAFREKFDKLTIICPLNSDMAVLKGAVVFGHTTKAIVGRVAKCHYGLALRSSEVSGRTISLEQGKKKSFFILIKKGKKIEVGDVVTEYEIVLPRKSDWVDLEVYTTEEDTPPTYIDDEQFKRLGNIHIKLPRFKTESVLILTISYDETEFKVVATDKNTGRCFVGICEFLEKDIAVSKF